MHHFWRVIQLIAIHNHPDSFAPSFADIATAYKRKYKYGVVVAHNGTIFKYSIIDEKYNELNALFAIDNYYDLVYFNNSITSELYKKSVEKLFDAEIRMEMF